MTLSCKIAPTPHLIKYPQSNCVGINGVAMLILLNDSGYRFIACHELFLVQIPLCRRRYFYSDRARLFWRMWLWLNVYENGTPLSLLLAGFDCFGIYAHSPSTLVTFLLRLKLSRGFRGRTRVKVSLMDLRQELLCWMSVCDFCILN